MSETTSSSDREFDSSEVSQAEGKRIIIEITDWDWHLHVGVPHASIPKSLLYQGWLSYTRGLEVQGRIIAPSAYRWKSLSFWLMELAPKPRVTKAELAQPSFQRVGHIGPTTSPDRRTDFSASAHLPQEALTSAVTALGSVWKILQLWAIGDPEAGAAIDWFSFSRAIPPKLVRDDWG
jgi:hypothetical protein